VTQLAESVHEALRTCIGRLSNDIEETFADLGRTDTSVVGETGLHNLQRTWEARIDGSATATQDILVGLRDQLQNLTSAVANNEPLDDTTAAIESRAESYRAQLDASVELAQIGMALGIVQHEFASTVQGIRRSIRSLQPWTSNSPELRTVYRDLRAGFDHLDAYLGLFTPMNRKLNREVVELTGEQIRVYLRDVFGERLRRHAIDLTWTPAFDATRVAGFASTFLPAFVNVVDNAIFWITFDKDSERWISLDADRGAFIVSNGGPGIEHRIAERIFEFGETTKPGGRGMGLYISREALRRDGYDLTLDNVGRDQHPSFRIAPVIADAAEEPSDD
jgi:signal transduction histidine kinase